MQYLKVLGNAGQITTLQFILSFVGSDEYSESVQVTAVHAMRHMNLDRNINALWEVSFHYSLLSLCLQVH